MPGWGLSGDALAIPVAIVLLVIVAAVRRWWR
jgi:hypothetical protein